MIVSHFSSRGMRSISSERFLSVVRPDSNDNIEGVGDRRIDQVIISRWPDGHTFLSVTWPVNERAGEAMRSPVSTPWWNGEPAPSAKLPFHPSPRPT